MNDHYFQIAFQSYNFDLNLYFVHLCQNWLRSLWADSCGYKTFSHWLPSFPAIGSNQNLCARSLQLSTLFDRNLANTPNKKHIPVHASTGVSMFLYQVTSLLMLVIINLCSAILCLNPLRPTRINHHKSEAPSRQGCSYALIHWDWQELLRNHLTWVLNRYWVVQYCQDPRTRHNKQLASHNWHCRKFVLRLSHRAKRSTIVPWQLWECSKKRNRLCKTLVANIIMSSLWYTCPYADIWMKNSTTIAYKWIGGP